MVMYVICLYLLSYFRVANDGIQQSTINLTSVVGGQCSINYALNKPLIAREVVAVVEEIKSRLNSSVHCTKGHGSKQVMMYPIPLHITSKLFLCTSS